MTIFERLERAASYADGFIISLQPEDGEWEMTPFGLFLAYYGLLQAVLLSFAISLFLLGVPRNVALAITLAGTAAVLIVCWRSARAFVITRLVCVLVMLPILGAVVFGGIGSWLLSEVANIGAPGDRPIMFAIGGCYLAAMWTYIVWKILVA